MSKEKKEKTPEEQEAETKLGYAMIAGFVITYLISPIFITVGWNWGVLRAWDCEAFHKINLITALCLVLFVKGITWAFKSLILESGR